MEYNYIFGPVPSRRLGKSLGVDLVKHKTCPFDCIYCECGKTTQHVSIRKEYVNIQDVIFELDHFLKDKPSLDYITFSGSGEPMLNVKIEEIIKHIKANYKYKIAILTNSFFITTKELRKEILDCDLIVPSLDAATQNIFQVINRPVIGININDIIKGLIDLRKEYHGGIWLEIFIIPGVNNSDEELKKIVQITKKISPDKVQINFLDRPGTEPWIKPLNSHELNNVKKIFQSIKNLEIIARVKNPEFDTNSNSQKDISNQIIGLLKRRPCTEDDICKMSNIDKNAVKIQLKRLVIDKKIELSQSSNGMFYKIKKSA